MKDYVQFLFEGRYNKAMQIKFTNILTCRVYMYMYMYTLDREVVKILLRSGRINCDYQWAKLPHG